MFLIIDPRIVDRDAYVATVKQWRSAAQTATNHGGRLLVCGDWVEVVDGPWKPTNLLIVEFPDGDSLNSWVGSSDYAEMAELVSQSAVMSVVAVTSHSDSE